MFIYPSLPRTIATTIDIAISRLRLVNRDIDWRSWQGMQSQGAPIPAMVAQGIADSDLIVADLTTFNLNVVFELGMCVGMGLPMLPIRDITYSATGSEGYGMLEFLNDFGCVDFRNSNDIVARLQGITIPGRLTASKKPPLLDCRVLVINGAFETEGVRQLGMALQSAKVEADTVSIASIQGQVEDLSGAIREYTGIIIHLMDPARSTMIQSLEPYRRGVFAENARGMFIAGMAHGSGVPLIVLQEGQNQHPVDYAYLVRSYDDPTRISELLRGFLAEILTVGAAGEEAERILRRLTEGPVEVISADDPVVALAAQLEVGLTGFMSTWRSICVPLIDGEDSYSFITGRTARDSRQTISFVACAARRALRHGRLRISQADLHAAAEEHSHAALDAIRDLINILGNGRLIIDALKGADEIIAPDDVLARLEAEGFESSDANAVLAALVDAGALGIWDSATESAIFRAGLGDWRTRFGNGGVSQGNLLAFHSSLHIALNISRHFPGPAHALAWALI